MIEIVRGDITEVEVDAIVNAANKQLMGGGGVDGAIHRRGGPQIMEECRKIISEIGILPTGEVVRTTAGKLRAKYVFHTVGPIYDPSQPELMERQLASCYINSLHMADKFDCKSIAFPNISTGVYHFPKKAAARVAIKAVREYLSKYDVEMKILYVCFDEENFSIYSDLLK